MNPKFDPTGVQTHDLQIMTVNSMSLRRQQLAISDCRLGSISSIEFGSKDFIHSLAVFFHDLFFYDLHLRVRFWAVQNLFWAGRCPKLGLNPPFTAQNCPKLPKIAQNCLKLPTDYESTKFILGQISNLLSLSFLMLENIN